VAARKSAFASILTTNAPNVKSFERGKSNKDDVEKEFKKFKKDFDLDRFLSAGAL
jgi:hypothetical protein